MDTVVSSRGRIWVDYNTKYTYYIIRKLQHFMSAKEISDMVEGSMITPMREVLAWIFWDICVIDDNLPYFIRDFSNNRVWVKFQYIMDEHISCEYLSPVLLDVTNISSYQILIYRCFELMLIIGYKFRKSFCTIIVHSLIHYSSYYSVSIYGLYLY